MDSNTLSQKPLMMSIAAVERDTGLSKDTLRVWERRYEFPQPVRDGQGERCYPLDQIEKLRLIKRLLDVGHRPSRLVSLPMQDLQALTERSADAQGLGGPTRRRGVISGRAPLEVDEAPRNGRAHLLSYDSVPVTPEGQGLHAEPSPWVELCLAHVEQHDPLGLRAELARGLMQMGLSRFIAELVTPLLTAIGNGWLRGRIQIFQEHWATHYIQQTLHSAIQSFPVPQGPTTPRVLLSTLPGEHHALGLLVVESWLCLDQAQAINLGPQTPLWDLVACHPELQGRHRGAELLAPRTTALDSRWPGRPAGQAAPARRTVGGRQPPPAAAQAARRCGGAQRPQQPELGPGPVARQTSGATLSRPPHIQTVTNCV